jgi:hypothetical protein
MPVLPMLETIFYKMMERVDTKHKEAVKWPGTICPKIRKKIEKFSEWSKGIRVRSAGKGVYAIKTGEFEKDIVVDIPARSCDCRRCQLRDTMQLHVVG